MIGRPAAKIAPLLPFHIKIILLPLKKKYDYNHKMLTYGPGSNIFVDQKRPFIHIYFRQTILSGSDPIKSSLSRGDIFSSKNFDFKDWTRKIITDIFLIGRENRITQLWCLTIEIEF